MNFTEIFLVIWVSSVSGEALTTAGPMTMTQCQEAKRVVQTWASKTKSVTALCLPPFKGKS